MNWLNRLEIYIVGTDIQTLEEYRTYTLNFADLIFARIFRKEKVFDIVVILSANKYMRSENDKYIA